MKECGCFYIFPESHRIISIFCQCRQDLVRNYFQSPPANEINVLYFTFNRLGSRTLACLGNCSQIENMYYQIKIRVGSIYKPKELKFAL